MSSDRNHWPTSRRSHGGAWRAGLPLILVLGTACSSPPDIDWSHAVIVPARTADQMSLTPGSIQGDGVAGRERIQGRINLPAPAVTDRYFVFKNPRDDLVHFDVNDPTPNNVRIKIPAGAMSKTFPLVITNTDEIKSFDIQVFEQVIGQGNVAQFPDWHVRIGPDQLHLRVFQTWLDSVAENPYQGSKQYSVEVTLDGPSERPRTVSMPWPLGGVELWEGASRRIRLPSQLQLGAHQTSAVFSLVIEPWTPGKHLPGSGGVSSLPPRDFHLVAWYAGLEAEATVRGSAAQ